MKNYYDILGVAKNASEDDIKKAFRKIAQKDHPDKKGGNEARFKEASEAYSTLSDAKKRASYDMGGQGGGFGGQQQGGQGGGFGGYDFSGFQGGNVEFDMGDIFGQFFGGGGQQAQRQARGRDVSIDIELSFKESIFGVEKRVVVSKVGVCRTCSGSGGTKDSKPITCKTCNGKGEIRENRQTIFGTIAQSRVCDTCHGKGSVPSHPCPTCRGAGIAKQQEELNIKVPAGVSNGETILMKGQGEAASGGLMGDLYVNLHVKSDSTIVREGNNLVMSLSIKLTEGLLGSNHILKTLEGDEKIEVPAGVTHGEMLRIKGKGVPSARGRGDLLVRIDIQFPKKLSKVAREYVEKLKAEGL